MDNRLQFRHHTPIFETREEAIEYIYSQIRFADEGLAFEDKSYGFSLLAEPTILRYKNEDDETDPHVIVAIGAATNEGTQYNDNRFCIIDIDKTEKEIKNLWEELEKAIKSLSIVTKNTNTLKLYSEKTESGTVISGDVVVATSQIFDDARKPNVILNTEDGLFTYVNMEVDEETGHISFTVNGDTKEWTISDNYLVKGYYSKKDESLHLLRKDGEDVVISLENLIDEWGVEDNPNTPIVLTRERVGYGDDALHNHVEPWQDVLRADVRLADTGSRPYNILKKTSDGRSLYVDGLASNITFFKDGQEISVQDAISEIKDDVSSDSTNVIYKKADGYYATAQLKYKNKENKLVFTTSNVTGGTTVEEIQLNAVEAFKKIIYDPVTENLIIMYVDGNGDLQEVQVPIGEMMRDWEWDIQNEGHNVKLHKQRVIAGNDKVSADAAIYDDPDNILVDKNHELFVKGTADNIRYGREGNVSVELDKLNANDANINTRLNETSGKVDTLRTEFDAEVERATTEEQKIESKLDNEISRSKEKDVEHDGKISTIEQIIGDGFTTDGHETVTYKFNELSAKTNSISAKTDTINVNLGLLSAKTEAEIVRAKGEEQRIEKKFDDALGDGFNIRNTVRDEFDKEKSERIGEDARLQAEINALSASTDGKLVDVINIDHSINVDKTDAVRPVIKVNLSNETTEGIQNVIKLNNDGLYAGVDLDYYFESGTSKNVLVFKTTNGTKTFDLKTNSVVDKIYYDSAKEAIIIEYTVDGKRMPDVVVPVHDLINEWRVSEDTNGAIKLHKFRESGATQDILYAESIISDHEDNILVNDNGALYVSRKPITDLEDKMDSVEERIDAAEADIDTLENGLAAEVTRATGEEQRIEDKLDQEITRSTNKDNEHNTAIANEITRAQNAERDLHDEIVAESTRAISAETALNTKIDREIERSSEKDSQHDSLLSELRTDLNNEIGRSTAEDTEIRRALSAETTARISGDTVLDTKINDEITRATGEEQRIEGKLDREIERSIGKDNEHDTKINEVRADLSNEISRSTAEDTEIRHALSAETTARISGDTILDTKINGEITRATGEEQRIEGKLDREIERSTDKDNEHDTKINGLRTDLGAEIENRRNADNGLSTAIHAEEDRAKTVESAITQDLVAERTARNNADNVLEQKILTETNSRISGDTILDTKINGEITRATGEEQRIEDKLDQEITRSTNKDNEHNTAIANEITRAQNAERDLHDEIVAESTRAISAETILDTKINGEIQRAEGAENALQVSINAEKQAREDEDTRIWNLCRPISFEETRTIHNERVRNTGTTPDEVRQSLKISKSDKNIIIADEFYEGVYATASLEYDEAKNVVSLKGSNDVVLSEIQLSLGSLLDDIYYDYNEKELVILYHTASGVSKKIPVPVADLFNEWDIQNPSEKSAIELHKIHQSAATETENVDILWGRVLITDDRNGDGKPDEGSDNIIEIRGNGLYANGSAMTEALRVAECTKNETRSVEVAVLGEDVGDRFPCGSGFTYTPFENACFISAATSMYDADKILDKYVCSAYTRITNVEEEVDCLHAEVDVVENNVIGLMVGDCGLNPDGTPYTYPSDSSACFISAATSMYNADKILDAELCKLRNEFNCISGETKMTENVLGVVGNCSAVIKYPTTSGCLLSTATTFANADAILETAVCKLLATALEGSERPTTSTRVEQDPDNEDNKIIKVDVRLSHGKAQVMTDGDFTITADTSDVSEYSDTNVLRIVDIAGSLPNTAANGLFLSNVWDCKEYTEGGVGTPDNKYRTDDSATSMNLFANRYRNGVRYNA